MHISAPASKIRSRGKFRNSGKFVSFLTLHFWTFQMSCCSYLIDGFDLQMTTAKLIDLYHQERFNDQMILLDKHQSGEELPLYGILSVRVYFRNNCLFVEVIRARGKTVCVNPRPIRTDSMKPVFTGVIPLDSNGLSDPFVVVELLPKRVFQASEQSTHVQKSTLNPVFDECFEL